MRSSGEIDVARMLYDRDLELTDFLPSLNRALAEAPRPPSARRSTSTCASSRPASCTSRTTSRASKRGPICTSPAPRPRPVLDGRIEALDGTVTFRDRVFEMQGGTIDFRPDLGLAAALNITAESTIDTPDATYIGRRARHRHDARAARDR